MEKYSIPIIILAFILISLFFSISYKRAKMKEIRESWGKLPKKNRKPIDEKNLKLSLRAFESFKKSGKIVDDITWNDLDLFEVFNLMNNTFSSVGTEALYRRLRTPDPSQEDEKYIRSLMDYFEKNKEKREKIQFIFARMGRLDDNGVLNFIFKDRSKRIFNMVEQFLFAIIPLVSALAIHMQVNMDMLKELGTYPLMALFVSIAYNLYFSNKVKNEYEIEYKAANYLTSTINLSGKLLKYDLPVSEELEKVYKPIKSLGRYSFMSQADTNSGLAMITYLLNGMFRFTFITFALTINKLQYHRQEIVDLWKQVGDIEASIAASSYKLARNNTCQVSFIDQHKIEAKDLCHPLLNKPVANDVNWTKNTIVSGSNASGKSTYVRSVALNAILAQTFYFAHAKEFAIKKGKVLTSMAVKDDILRGDSYFIAEIKSLKRIIDNIERSPEDYYFVDEILRGTNTIERIAASSSIIDHMIAKDQLAFVATHDIELTAMFNDKVRNIHFRENVTEDQGIKFDYKLYEGPSTTRNAIKLLEVMDFPENLVQSAQSKVRKFEEDKSWI